MFNPSANATKRNPKQAVEQAHRHQRRFILQSYVSTNFPNIRKGWIQDIDGGSSRHEDGRGAHAPAPEHNLFSLVFVLDELDDCLDLLCFHDPQSDELDCFSLVSWIAASNKIEKTIVYIPWQILRYV